MNASGGADSYDISFVAARPANDRMVTLQATATELSDDTLTLILPPVSDAAADNIVYLGKDDGGWTLSQVGRETVRWSDDVANLIIKGDTVRLRALPGMSDSLMDLGSSAIRVNAQSLEILGNLRADAITLDVAFDITLAGELTVTGAQAEASILGTPKINYGAAPVQAGEPVDLAAIASKLPADPNAGLVIMPADASTPLSLSLIHI